MATSFTVHSIDRFLLRRCGLSLHALDLPKDLKEAVERRMAEELREARQIWNPGADIYLFRNEWIYVVVKDAVVTFLRRIPGDLVASINKSVREAKGYVVEDPLGSSEPVDAQISRLKEFLFGEVASPSRVVDKESLFTEEGLGSLIQDRFGIPLKPDEVYGSLKRKICRTIEKEFSLFPPAEIGFWERGVIKSCRGWAYFFDEAGRISSVKPQSPEVKPLVPRRSASASREFLLADLSLACSELRENFCREAFGDPPFADVARDAVRSA